MADLVRRDGTIWVPGFPYDIPPVGGKYELTGYNRAVVEQLQMSTAKVLEVSNVPALQHKPTDAWADLPPVVPPWPSMWMESRCLKEGVRLAIARMGTYVTCKDVYIAPPPPALLTQLRTLGMGDMRFTVTAMTYAEIDHSVYGPITRWQMFLDSNGHILKGVEVQFNHQKTPLREVPLQLATTVLALMHCKNIAMDVVRPDAKLSKAHRKRHGVPLVDYQTVRLKLPRSASSSGAPGDGLSGRPAHIAAGHFAHYGDCCPGVHPPNQLLFGRHQGHYWVPSHVRGNPALGETIRDYDVVVDEPPA